MKRFLSTLTVIFASCLSVSAVLAAPPWMDFVRFQRIEADPDKAYELSQDNGPWMIMATTFQGPDADSDAKRLVYELRKTYKMQAYTHSATFDYSESFVGRGVDRYGEPRRMRHQANAKVDEVAVLVGDYPSVEKGSRAQRDLQRIKTMKPEVLSGEADATSQTFSELRRLHRNLLRQADDSEAIGPMRLAFVTTNPMLPGEYFRPSGIDKFVVKLNKGVAHGLLDCTGKYTVKVASFNGFVTSNPSRIRDVEENDWKTSRLEEGALRAHKLTVALRAKGYEAYQFHDRNSSIVTVGSFDRAPTRSRGGQLVYDAQVRELIYRFGAKQKSPALLPGAQHPGVKPTIMPEKLLGIPFDVHPTLIPVPQRSLSSEIARRTLSVR